MTVSLKPGQTYRFRYLLDGERWETTRRPMLMCRIDMAGRLRLSNFDGGCR